MPDLPPTPPATGGSAKNYQAVLKRPVVWLTAVVALLIVGALLIRPASGDDSANLGEPKLNGIAEDGIATDLDDGSYVNPSSWPARGDLLDDKDLLRRAVDHWRKHEGDVLDFWWPERRDEVEVIYAGIDDEHYDNVVVMHFNGLLAKYREGRGSELDGWSIDLLNLRQSVQGTDNTYRMQPIDVIYLGEDVPFEENQYLVSPNITKLEVATDVKRIDEQWQRVTLRNGLATVPRIRPHSPLCFADLFLRSTNKAGKAVSYLHNLGDMGGPGGFLPIATKSEGLAPHVRATALCSENGVGLGASQVTWKDLWTGLLPEDSHPFTLLSERAEGGGDRPIRWQVNFVRNDGVYDGLRVGGDWTDDSLEGDEPPAAAAMWWYGKSSHRWFLVVAGSSDVTSLRVSGGLPVKEAQRRTLIVPGPKGSKDLAPETKVSVEAHNAKGEPVRVLWAEQP